MSDDANDGIASLNRLFQRFCNSQPNEGGRLSMAKTKFSEAVFWLRVNADVHRERMMTDERETERMTEAAHG